MNSLSISSIFKDWVWKLFYNSILVKSIYHGKNKVSGTSKFLTQFPVCGEIKRKANLNYLISIMSQTLNNLDMSQ